MTTPRCSNGIFLHNFIVRNSHLFRLESLKTKDYELISLYAIIYKFINRYVLKSQNIDDNNA